MALLQILLLLLYALPSLLLPITSNPLGLEDTPDNLAYAAQSFDGRSEYEGVNRKIPKSIFITPNHHPDFHMNCPNGYQLQDGNCVKKQNFDVNPLALITAQFQQNLDTTVDYDEYDYENFGDSTESTEPLHIPLSVSFDDLPPIRGSYNDGIQNMPFLDDNLDRNEETSQKYRIPTSTESKSTENVVPITPIAATAVSNVNNRTDDNVANNKDSTRADQDLNPTTVSNDVVITTPDESLLIFSDGGAISTTQKKVLMDLPENVFVEEEEENVGSTERDLDPTTTSIDNEPVDVVRVTLSDRETDRNHMVQNHIELTTQGDDQNILEKELQSESLFKDDSSTGTSINVSDGTTEIYENDIEVTTESLQTLSDKEANIAISTSTSTIPLKPSNKVDKPIVVVPTVEQVQIVTPVQQTTTTSHSTTHHHRKKSNSQSIPSSTSVYNGELQTAERLNINESMLNKKLRESVMKHELNEDAIETIDTNNRFVYTHLDSSSNEPEPPSTTTSSTTMQPPTTPQRSMFDQLRFISEDSRRNNRVRFPEPSAMNIFSNFKGGTIKFPGPVQQRTNEPLFNRLIPDNIPKKPPESSADRPLFSWLPAGTSFDFSRNPNHGFRFWNKQPLIRDRTMASNESAEHPRSNSKSPTDSLYKDAPASEVYKVISSKNYKHDNR